MDWTKLMTTELATGEEKYPDVELDENGEPVIDEDAYDSMQDNLLAQE